MTRQARQQSETGYYHVMTRGIGRQLLFEDRADCLYYLWLLERHSGNTGVLVCAYCLMQNHVHMLLFNKQGNVSELMKRMGVSYSYYFNQKYDRKGHLFQDRYKSDAIKDNSHLLSVFKYILRNSQAAGGASADRYEWSSYRFYGDERSFVDTSVFQGILGSFQNYASFIAQDDAELSVAVKKHIVDSHADETLRSVLGISSGTVLQSYSIEKRNDAIVKLLEAGLSIRQIERLTGISRGIIQNITW